MDSLINEMNLESGAENRKKSEIEIEMEPKLKCEKLPGLVYLQFQKQNEDLESNQSSGGQQSWTSLAVNSKFMVLGLNDGTIHVVDVLGNPVQYKETEKHTARVNQLSIDHDGEYFASCGDDGKVIVTGLESNAKAFKLSFGKPVHSVGIDPFYNRKDSGRRVLMGVGEKVVMNYMGGIVGWGQYKQYDIEGIKDDEGPVHDIKWRGQYALWINDKGVRVYNVQTSNDYGVMVAFIQKPENCPPYSICPWRVSGARRRGDQYQFVISFGSAIISCGIKQIKQNLIETDKVDFLQKFSLDDKIVAGIANLDSLLVLLTKSNDDDDITDEPIFLVYDSQDDYKYELVSSEKSAIVGFEENKAKDYILEYASGENQFIILSPKDSLLYKVRDENDHLDWLLDQKHFDQALLVTERNENLSISFSEVGRKYLDFLIDKEHYYQAADLCPKILRQDVSLWEEEIQNFANIHQLQAITPQVPFDDQFILSKSVYEMILSEFLKSDTEHLLIYIQKWPSDIYSVSSMIEEIENYTYAELPDQDVKNVKTALAKLYTLEERFVEAMELYFILGHTDIFELIRKNDLYAYAHENLIDLIKMDQEEAMLMLLEFRKEIPVEEVCERLQDNEKLLFHYLHVIHNEDEEILPEKYHGILVRLYANYEPRKLIEFLQSSQSYNIDDALDECKIRGLIPEQIYLLSRMGKLNEALELLVVENDDPEAAVNFCKEHDDPQLWDDLIDYSSDKPSFMSYLLKNVGNYMNSEKSQKLIKSIEHGLEMPGIRESLIQMLRDFQLQVSLQQGFMKIVASDCYSLTRRNLKAKSNARIVHGSSTCSVCNDEFLSRNPDKMKNLIIFNCGHAYHEECLVGDRCFICEVSGHLEVLSTYVLPQYIN